MNGSVFSFPSGRRAKWIVLAVWIAVFIGVSAGTFLTELGFVVAFGVLLDTFLVRSILVPALALMAGDNLWWPSSLSKQGTAAPPPASIPPDGSWRHHATSPGS
jgi:RND superfamily putative drug exporter